MADSAIRIGFAPGVIAYTMQALGGSYFLQGSPAVLSSTTRTNINYAMPAGVGVFAYSNPTITLTYTQFVPVDAPERMFAGYIDTSSYLISWYPPASQAAWVDCGFVGGVSGSVLSVSTVNSGVIHIGDLITGIALNNNTMQVASFGTGSGGTGTYNLTGSDTVAAGTVLGAVQGYYNVYKDGSATPMPMTGLGLLNPGITPNPVVTAGQGLSNMPTNWFVDRPITPGASHTYRVSLTKGLVETSKSPSITMQALANGSSAQPAAPTAPISWVPDFQLPTGGNTWLVDQTTDSGGVKSWNRPGTASSGTATNNLHCGFLYAMSNANQNGGDLIVVQAGLQFPVPISAGGFVVPFQGAANWTYIITSEDPVYKSGGLLPPILDDGQYRQLEPCVCTSSLAANATSATLNANQLGMTDSAGNWIRKTGWYYTLFTQGSGSAAVQEERRVLYTNGSAAISWNGLNGMYQKNGVSTFGSQVGGSGYTTHFSSGGAVIAWPSVPLTGGHGTGAAAHLTVNSGAVTTIAGLWGGNNYQVGDVLSADNTKMGGTGSGFSITITALQGNGEGLAATTDATLQVSYLPGVTPAEASAAMPTFLYGAVNQTCISFTQPNPASTGPASSRVRFVGLNFQPTYGSPRSLLSIISFANKGTTGTGKDPAVPDYIYFDRCLGGNDTEAANWSQIPHGVVNLTCDHFVMSQCYIWGVVCDFRSVSTDSNNGGLAGGPHCWRYNYLQCGSENIIYGGGFIPEPPLMAHDISIYGNMSHKPRSWLVGVSFPITFPSPFAVNGQNMKNHIEFKIGNRIACYGNLVLNAWMGSVQSYHSAAFSFGGRAQLTAVYTRPDTHAAWAQVTDGNVHDNACYYVGTLFNAFNSDATPSVNTRNIRVVNNQELASPWAQTSGFAERVRTYQMQGPVVDFILDHNTTLVNTSSPQSTLGSQVGLLFVSGNPTPGVYSQTVPFAPNSWSAYQDRMTFTNNILDCGNIVPVFGAITWIGNPTGLPYFSDYPNRTIDKNLTTANDPTTYGTTPGPTYVPGTFSSIAYASIGFADFSRGNNLPPLRASDWNVVSGTYVAAGTDGKPLGATMVASALTYPRLAGNMISGTLDFSAQGSKWAGMHLGIVSFYPGYTAGGKNAAQQVAAILAQNSNILLTGYTIVEQIDQSNSTPGHAYSALWNTISANNWWGRVTFPSGAIVTTTFGANFNSLNPTTFTNVVGGQNYIQYRATFDPTYNPLAAGQMGGLYTDDMFWSPRWDVDWNQDGVNESHTNSVVQQRYRDGYAALMTYRRAAQTANQVQWANIADWGANGTTFSAMQAATNGYKGVLDGGFMESIIGQSYSYETFAGWSAMMAYYQFCQTMVRHPEQNIFAQDGTITDYQAMRYGLCSCLLGDAAYYHSSGPGVSSYTSIVIYDEFSFALGHAFTPAFGVQVYALGPTGVYRRDFENGISLVNPKGNGSQTVTLERTYYKLRGTQDPSVNNAAAVTSVTLADRDGLILSRTPT